MNKIRGCCFLVAALLLGTSLLGCVQNNHRPPQTTSPPAPTGSWYWTPDVLPIAVNVDRDMTLLARNEIAQAIRVWNDAAGMELFRYVDFDIQTVIVAGVPDIPGYGKVNVFRTELGRLPNGDYILGLTTRFGVTTQSRHMQSALVRLDDDLSFGQFYPVMLHELGHVLGLEHALTTDSIMYHHCLESNGLIEEEDVELIQDMLRSPSSP